MGSVSMKDWRVCDTAASSGLGRPATVELALMV